MKIMFIEDTKEDMELIKNIVEKFHEITPLYFSSAAEFYKSEEAADAVILDIDIPDENGLMIAKKLREHGYDEPIVFVSWHQEYEHESFNVNPFCFVRKEFLDFELTQCIENLLKEYLRKKQKFIYEDEKGSAQISANQILYIERIGNYLNVYLKTRAIVKIRNMSLKKVLEQDIFGFCQINKSSIVNFYYVKQFNEMSEIIMNDGAIFDISKRKEKATYDAYINFLNRER